MSRRSASLSSPKCLIKISVSTQRLTLFCDGQVEMLAVISTSAWGLGSEPGSNKTPLGRLRVREMHGAGQPLGTIFKSRQPVGLWKPNSPVLPDDLITSRLLWLEGLEPGNKTTYERYIYIHGTNQEHRLGTEASHGCIRMTNEDVIRLYDFVSVGTEVFIER